MDFWLTCLVSRILLEHSQTSHLWLGKKSRRENPFADTTAFEEDLSIHLSSGHPFLPPSTRCQLYQGYSSQLPISKIWTVTLLFVRSYCLHRFHSPFFRRCHYFIGISTRSFLSTSIRMRIDYTPSIGRNLYVLFPRWLRFRHLHILFAIHVRYRVAFDYYWFLSVQCIWLGCIFSKIS